MAYHIAALDASPSATGGKMTNTEPNAAKNRWQRFDHAAIHWALIEKAISPQYGAMHAQPDGYVERQALFCPYYVTLDGVLGADWGVVVNPESTRFGLLTFEHDFCGCPPHPEGNQRTDEWLDRKLTEANLAKRVSTLQVPGNNAVVEPHRTTHIEV